jgi:hypothetical protein
VKCNAKVPTAIAAILSEASAIAYGATLSDNTVEAASELREVIVSATQREANLQDVPITLQVLTGQTITQLNVNTFDDYLRYLPNVNAGYAITVHGDPSNNLDAMINLPLVADKLAVRAVVYNESRGRYIDNIPGTFTQEPTDASIVRYFGDVVRPSVSINNYRPATGRRRGTRSSHRPNASGGYQQDQAGAYSGS